MPTTRYQRYQIHQSTNYLPGTEHFTTCTLLIACLTAFALSWPIRQQQSHPLLAIEVYRCQCSRGESPPPSPPCYLLPEQNAAYCTSSSTSSAPISSSNQLPFPVYGAQLAHVLKFASWVLLVDAATSPRAFPRAKSHDTSAALELLHVPNSSGISHLFRLLVPGRRCFTPP